MTKVCIVTGTRADYGLLRWVMNEIKISPLLKLQTVVTGSHLSPEHGLTWEAIVEDGFSIDAKVEMLMSSDTSVGITKSIGLALTGFADTFERLKPDLLLVLGDRYEILAAVIAATMARIPVAHLHGGELTEGAFDDAIRHAITKMSHLHFVAADEYMSRVLQMGESSEHVYNVGGLGIDNMLRLKLMDKSELENDIGFKFGTRNLLITFHPVTLESNASTHQLKELIDALDSLKDTHLIFTMPNADTESRQLSDQVKKYVSIREGTAKFFPSLGQVRYLSCLKHIDAVVGNSSSGLTEAPSFQIGTVNIGERQTGRLKADSVIDCAPVKQDILRALEKLFSENFRSDLRKVLNPYGEGGATEKIVHILNDCKLETLLKKKFQDLSFIHITNRQ